jgi:hypothetical protein
MPCRTALPELSPLLAAVTGLPKLTRILLLLAVERLAESPAPSPLAIVARLIE